MPTYLKDKLSFWLKSVQQSFILSLPVVILGSIALSILQLSHLFTELESHSNLMQLASWLHQSSYAVMALILTIGISYKLSNAYKTKAQLPYSSITNTIISLVCFIGIITIDHPDKLSEFIGVQSIAKAIITAIISTEMIVLFYNNKYQRFNFLQFEVNSEIHNALRACFPAIIIPFLILSIYSSYLADNDILKHIIPFFIGEADPKTGLSFIQSMGFICINQIVWFFGIHPSSIIEINPELIFSPINDADFTKHFLDTYAHLGGAGSTFGLVICLLFSKNTFHKKLGLYATIPSIFNINELLIFGVPIVLNRFLILPFILAPLVTTTIARLLIETGLLTLDSSMSAWNTPIILAGYLSGGINAATIQLLLILISAAIYWPFIKRYEESIDSQHKQNIKGMISELCNPDLNFKNLLIRQTPLASFCRQLQADMKKQLGNQYFSMYYQAKINQNKEIIGSEALIRWHHPELGNIPPSIFINIAETDHFIHTIGRWIQDRCMKDIRLMKNAEIKNLQVAINVSPIELTKPGYFNNFISTIEKHNIDFHEIELEITESQRLNLTDEIIKGITLLSEKGVSIAVDDFGMGYTSLKYLNSFKVNTIKLDGCITKDVLESSIVQEIVRSLSTLTSSINGKLVAEWVENEEQFNQLAYLGCDQFQGAYFSMPVNRDDFIELYSKKMA
jgi:lactose/cellobiose-specific phosphotransferase system IIC component